MADGNESKTSKGRHSKEIEAGSWVGRMNERFIYENRTPTSRVDMIHHRNHGKETDGLAPCRGLGEGTRMTIKACGFIASLQVWYRKEFHKNIWSSMLHNRLGKLQRGGFNQCMGLRTMPITC